MMKKGLIILLLICVNINGFSQEEKDRYSISNLTLNNGYSNFGTSFYGSDKLIFAMPAKKNFIINNIWKPNNQPFLDLYVGTIKEDGNLSNVEKFSSKINTKYHDADVTFSPDKRTVYFTRSNYVDGVYGKDTLGINRLKMFKANVGAQGEWENIKVLPFNNDNYSVGHPSLSEDGKTLYFVSDMPGTLGKTDIFKVAVLANGSYGKPINLGPEVNTPEKEMFPFIDGNDELYYSTNGRDGLGMLDIYVSKLNPDGILPPIHLGDKINSDRDDFAFIINTEKREGYFSSNRFNGKGDDDIYYFKEEIPIVYPCDQVINVIVRNERTGELLPSAVVSIAANDEALVENQNLDNNAMLKFEAICSTKYEIKANKKYFLAKSITVETTDKDKEERTIEIKLSPDEFIVVRDKVMIDINTIYFDYDSYKIRPDAAIELDKVAGIMKKYEELIVEAGSHTDARGRDAYNDKLSGRRANSTVKYLISRGVSPDRITSKGYGEKDLINKCSNGVKCTDEEHQFNRRTEFVIVNPEVIN